jgi:UDP-xylose/UDP-N-acetylglucosamine transporter B4
MKVESSASSTDFTTGLLILLVAQTLSAYMGAYVEDTYAAYGASWTENLFYSHFLALPMFLPLWDTLSGQWDRLASTSALDLSAYKPHAGATGLTASDALVAQVLTGAESLPQGVVFLLLNALAQLACISGVNLLSAKSSAVTVTIVLNIRKLVSFILSTWIFGHHLSPMMMLGSALVFGSGALYGWETSWRLPNERRRLAGAAGAANGGVSKKGQ